MGQPGGNVISSKGHLHELCIGLSNQADLLGNVAVLKGLLRGRHFG
jgi:hypothetical protein